MDSKKAPSPPNVVEIEHAHRTPRRRLRLHDGILCPPGDRAGQDAGLLLGRLARELQPDAEHHRHDLRRQRARSTTGWSSSSPVPPRSSPALAESWDVSPDGKSFTFHLRHGVKWQSNKTLQADPRLQRRRRAVLVRAAVEGRQPIPQGLRRRVRLLQRHELQQAAGVDREVDADTVRFTLTAPQAPFLADLAMDFAADPVEGIRRRAAEAGQARADRPGADRHRAVRVRRSTSATRPSATRVRRLLGREAEARCAGVLDQQGPGGAAGQAARQRVPGHGVPESGRPAGDQGGSRRCN